MIHLRFQNKFLLPVCFIVYGFTSLVAQLILLRELSVLFYGNELFIGFSLGAWLLWVGLGSLLGNKLQPRFFRSLFIILAPVIPLQIVMIRLAKLFFGFGMTVGPFAMMATTAVLLLPIGFVVGSIFSTGTSFSKKSGLLLPPHIYFLESIGAVMGGIAYTIFLSGRFSNFNIAIFLSALILIAGAFFISTLQKRSAGIFAASVFLTILASLPFCNRLTHRAEWKGYELLAVSDSRYENLALTKIGNLKQLFQNGLITASFPDPQAHEEMTHWPLLAHPNPQNVLLIGGGEAGELREILKHPVRSVDYFELDAGLIKLLHPFLDSEDQKAIGDARVHIRHEDIRAAFRRDLQSSVRAYDVIISNFPEPSNAQINRYFTQEFFKETKKHLAAGGIFALRIPSSENYLPPQISFFNQSIFRTLRSIFNEVSIIPGQSVILLAQNNRNKLDPQTLIERYAARGIKNIQVVPSYFPIKLDPSRVHFFHAQLTEGKLPALNRDFSPVSYFYFWNAWLLKFQNQNYFLWLMVSMIFAVFLLKYLVRKGNLFSKMPEAVTIFLLGFSGMVYEILILLAFQAIHGYIYWQIGYLFASFMTGLAAGSGFALMAPQKHTPLKKSAYFFLCAGQAAYGIFLALTLPCFETLPPQLSLPGLFNLLMVPAGIIPGFGFAYLARFTSGNKLYTADLWGSSLGAVVTGLFLIPFLGFFNLLWLIAFLLLFAGFLFKFQRR